MCVREGATAGTTKRSCRCWRNGQRGRRGGRRTGEARTARCDPQTTPGSCSASAEPPSGQREEGWTCTSLTHFCRIHLWIKIGYGQVGVVQSMCCPDKASWFTLYEISPLWPGSWWGGCHWWPNPARCSVEACSTMFGLPLFSHQPWQTTSAGLSLLFVCSYDLVQSYKRGRQTNEYIWLWYITTKTVGGHLIFI